MDYTTPDFILSVFLNIKKIPLSAGDPAFFNYLCSKPQVNEIQSYLLEKENLDWLSADREGMERFDHSYYLFYRVFTVI